jgi:hypothetical protein
MDKELFFDIVSDEWAGGLYRVTSDSGTTNFYYHHSLSDLEDDNQKTTVTESFFPGFAAFWKQFTLNNRWFTFHPLFIHPEERAFIREELKKVNWKLVADDKWREMYQRQWNKVLNNPASYYKPLQP